MTKIAVLGGGSYGTALAHISATKGNTTMLWARDENLVNEINKKQTNSRYLAGLQLSSTLHASTDPAEVLNDAEIVLSVIPSQYTRSTLQNFRRHLPQGATLICASKGIELDTHKLMSTVVKEGIGDVEMTLAQLSGPSFAAEMIKGQPTSVVIGCEDEQAAEKAREALSHNNFRVYTSTDLTGVELGGAIKNVVAIATGICDGLGFQDNTRAALVTRGLAEMSRLGEAMGAKKETFMGLSGMGDLVLTCTCNQSRNRQVGLKLGQGITLEQITAESNSVAEGVKTTKALFELGQKLNVELPITEQVYSVLYGNCSPLYGVEKLITRSLKSE